MEVPAAALVERLRSRHALHLAEVARAAAMRLDRGPAWTRVEALFDVALRNVTNRVADANHDRRPAPVRMESLSGAVRALAVARSLRPLVDLPDEVLARADEQLALASVAVGLVRDEMCDRIGLARPAGEPVGALVFADGWTTPHVELVVADPLVCTSSHLLTAVPVWEVPAVVSSAVFVAAAAGDVDVALLETMAALRGVSLHEAAAAALAAR